MNQKLRTARSGMVILFAVLCIVCLSLSLALSAHFAAYAEGENSATLNSNDGKGHDLWLVHYEGQEAGESLWNGIHNGKPISYIDSVRNEDGSYVVREGGEEDLNCFTPYRGINLTIALNPDYETANGTLSSLYDLENAEYIDNSGIGDASSSTDKYTSVTAQPLTDSAASEALTLEKEWKIATLCNTVEIEGTYIGDRGYAVAANYSLLRPTLGDTVVYDISSTAGYEKIIAVKYEQNREIYLQAGKGADGYFVSTEGWDEAEQTAAANENVNLINYLIRRLNALEATSEMGAYTLTVTAMQISAESGDISYAQSGKSYSFSVLPQGLGNDAENDATFETNFKYSFEDPSVEYTSDNEWLNKIGFTLSLGDGNIVLEEGKDYTIYVEKASVGLVDLRIVGSGNLSGYHTIKGAVRLSPAKNEWVATPNIVTWMYGTYNPNNNLIVGVPRLLDDPSDVKFRIVKITKNGEQDIEGLMDIHYCVYEDSDGSLKTDYIVTEDVIAILKDLSVGNYRLYASVYGVYSTSTILDRNYQPIDEVYVDFSVFMGTNSWKAGAEPTIKDGGWIAGKLSSTDGLINAESVFGTPILMIYKLGESGKKDTLIYSNKPEHSAEFGDIEVLKSLKSGRYYLSARVEGTDNYGELLSSSILFTVTPNNLPVWAVILIVAGALGIVALVFGILHQKGVLQMLTGKVIVSMRTRANVDATLAAIRAAKVAREAEASIAAAKAREAEEQANKDKK